jgi:S-adenosylmethionine-diacylgycerolhomoserine-N-methlytransferase
MLIDYLIEKNYIYSQSWEDGQVDLEAYELNENSVVCMITTGGDNVLNYLAHGVKHVTSVDMNCYQNYLLEIKRAIVITQSRSNAMEILAKSNYKLLNLEWTNIKKELTPEAQKWWEKNLHKFTNFWHSGIVGIFVLVIKTILWIFGLDKLINKLNANPDNSKELYWENINKINFMCWFLSSIMNFLIPFIGVPSKQYKLNTDKKFVSKVLKRILLNDWRYNYFYVPYTNGGTWNDDCCPLYLKDGYYEKLKTKLNDNNCLKIITNRMDMILTDKKFNRIILLDHMDWMDDDNIIEEFNNLNKLSTDDCLYCWRSFAYEQPFACLRHLDYVISERLFDHEQKPNRFGDRVGMYNSIHVAKIPKKSLLCKIKIPKYNLNFIDSLYVFANMMVQPFIKLNLNNKDFMNSYYKTQAKYYDAYRQNMLHGKKYLMYSIPWDKLKNNNIMLMAGGTGDLIDYILDYVPTFNSIVITDISKPMLDIANKRIEFNNFTNVKTRIEDLNDDNDYFKEEENSYDLILLTYSLTMIPNWSKTLNRALKYLKPGGILAITDFVVTEEQSVLNKSFWKFIFAQSHINLNENHLIMLKKKCDIQYLRIDDGNFPHVPLLTCNYYYGLFVKK